MSVIPNHRGKPNFLPQPTSIARAKRTRRHLALEKLEERVVLSYTFTYDPILNVAIATSDGSSGDTVAFEKDASDNLEHSVNGGPFSDQWTNTVTTTGQTVPDGTPVNVIEATGGTDEQVQIGQPGAGHQASIISSTFNISGAITSGSVTIDDSAGQVQAVGANQYQYDGTTFNGPDGLTVNIPNFQNQGVNVLGSDENDTFFVPGDAPDEPLNFVGGSGANIVNVGTAGVVSGINSPLSVTDPTGTTTLNINDTADATATTATIDNLSPIAGAPFELTGLSPAPIAYAGVTGGFGVTAINVNGGPGAGPGITYDLDDTAFGSTTTINDGAGPDTVNVGDPTDPNGIGTNGLPFGAVVVNGGGNTAINVNDNGSSLGGDTYTVTGTTVTTSFAFDFGGLTYAGATSLTLNTETGSGATVDVTGTANGITTTINDNSDSTVNITGTGTGGTLVVNTVGSATVNVVANSEPVNINDGGADTINIGSEGGAGTLAGIQSPVTIVDLPSFINLNFHDENDTTGRFWHLHTDNGADTASVDVSGSADVNYRPGDLTELTLNGGTGGNHFYVPNTAAAKPTTINAGLTGTNVVNVYGTGDGSTLNIDAQGSATNSVNLGGRPNVGMQDLADTTSTINITDSTGSENVTLDDSEDATGQTADLFDNGTTATVTGLAPAQINITDLGLLSLTINGGSGGNSFTVDGTPANAPTVINTGTGADTTNILATTGPALLTINGQDGADTVNIGDAGSLAGILGPIDVTNVLDFTALNIDGSSDTNAHDINLIADPSDTTAAFTGLAPATITYNINDISSIGVTLGNAGAASNDLTIDFSNGNPIAFLDNPGLFYDAGAGAANTLNLQGDLPATFGGPGFLDEVHDADGPGDGDISFTDNNGIDSGLVYSGLAVDPINDTATATNYTFNDFAFPDASFNVIDGPTVLGFNTIQFNSGASLPPGEFTTTNVANKTNVVFNSDDTGIGQNGLVDVPTASTGLTTLTFNLTNSANNFVTFEAEPAGVATSYNGSTGNDTTNVTGLGVPPATTLVANGGAGINTLNYDAGGETPTVTAGALPDEVLITIPGQGTVDAINYQFINITDVGPLTVTPTTNALNTVEGFNYVNAPVGSFATTVPTIFPVGTVTTGPVASDFTATVDWGDPTPDKTGGTITQDATDLSNYFVAGTHDYTQNGSYTDTLSVSFAGGAVTGTVNGATVSVSFPASTPPPVSSSSTVTVTQATLAVTALPIVGVEGTAIPSGQIATFIDAGGAQPVGDYTATITAIDPLTGVAVPGINGVAGTITQIGNSAEYTVTAPGLTFPEEGTYQIQVTVTDIGGTTPTPVTGASTAVIADAPLTAGAAVALTANTGVQLPATTVVGNFTDGNTAAPASDFTAVIDWGDGSPTSLGHIVSLGGGAFEVEAAHRYTSPGSYGTTIVVTDDGGSVVTLTGTATIIDSAVVAGTALTIHGVEGASTGTVVLGTFTDPNPLATASDVEASLTAWGDGTPATAIPVAVTLVGSGPGGAVFEITGSHTYADEGTFNIAMTVTTSGGVTTAVTATAVIADAPLTASGATVTGIEGTATAATVIATFTDANPGATVADFTTGGGSVVVNWGDGSAPVTLPAADVTASGSANGVTFTVTASHTYAEEGVFATTITITDDGGSTAVAHGQAVIADAALTAATTQPLVTGTEGLPLGGGLPVEVASFTDANPTAPVADFTATIDWGDGSANSIGTISQTSGVGTPFFVSGDHTYANAGTFPITVVVHDVGGSTVTISNTATINPVASTIAPIAGQVAFLTAASDTGLSTGGANTIAGPIYTSVTTPTFSGTLSPAVPNETVTLTATDTANGTTIQIGRATTNASGDWTITSTALPQGTYSVAAVATDSTGHVTSPTTTLASDLVIDTKGPVVENVVFNRAVGTIYVTYSDPTGAADGTAGSGVYMTSILDAANYSFSRPNTPADTWLITSITPVATGVAGQQEVAVTINNGRLIKGGFNFNFTIYANNGTHPGGVQDLAENGMQGTFYGTFPSGNAANGTNFSARLVAFHDQVLPPVTTIGAANPSGATAATTAAAKRAAERAAILEAHHDAALAHVKVKHATRHN